MIHIKLIIFQLRKAYIYLSYDICHLFIFSFELHEITGFTFKNDFWGTFFSMTKKWRTPLERWMNEDSLAYEHNYVR